jgi:hypothetical protein
MYIYFYTLKIIVNGSRKGCAVNRGSLNFWDPKNLNNENVPELKLVNQMSTIKDLYILFRLGLNIFRGESFHHFRYLVVGVILYELWENKSGFDSFSFFYFSNSAQPWNCLVISLQLTRSWKNDRFSGKGRWVCNSELPRVGGGNWGTSF